MKDLWLTRPVASLPAGTRGTGHKGTDRAAFSPLGSSAIYKLPSAYVTDVEPPPPDLVTPRLVEVGQRYAPLGLLALAAVLLTGCDESYGYGVLTGLGLAVAVVAMFVGAADRRASRGGR